MNDAETRAIYEAERPQDAIKDYWSRIVEQDAEITKLKSQLEEARTRLKTLADAADEETISRGAVEVSLEDKYRDRAAHRRLEDAYIAAMCATSDAIRQARSVLDAHKEGGKS